MACASLEKVMSQAGCRGGEGKECVWAMDTECVAPEDKPSLKQARHFRLHVGGRTDPGPAGGEAGDPNPSEQDP
jgi:hypothetical protein